MRGVTSLGFGLQGDFIISFKDSPDLFYYKFISESFKLIWKKPIPGNLNFNCWKYTSPSGEIFLKYRIEEICLYDQNLNLIRKLRAPGMMIGLLHGGRYAVVTNHASSGVPIKLSVVSALDLGNIHHHLDVPPEGEYDRDDWLLACGHEESGVAVTVHNKPYVDLYNREGELGTIYPLWYDAYSNNKKVKGVLHVRSTILKDESYSVNTFIYDMTLQGSRIMYCMHVGVR